MRVHSDPNTKAILNSFTSLLVATLDLSEPADVYVISPWMKDVELPIRDIVDTALIRSDSIRLLPLLQRIASKHRLKVFIRPPAELFQMDLLARLLDLARLLEQSARELEFSPSLLVEKLEITLQSDFVATIESFLVHHDTFKLGKALSNEAEVYFTPKLHAKILLTPLAALVGSANFTNGGLAYNDEIMLELTGRDRNALKEAVQGLTKRSTKWERYKFSRRDLGALENSQNLRNLAAHPVVSHHETLRNLLEELYELA